MIDRKNYDEARKQIERECSEEHGLPEPHRTALRNVRAMLDTARALGCAEFGHELPTEQVIAICAQLAKEAERVFEHAAKASTET